MVTTKNSNLDESNSQVVQEKSEELKYGIKLLNDYSWASDYDSYIESCEALRNALDATLSEIRRNEHTDPETGLPIKEYDCTIEEDMALINYHRQLNDKENYSQNCAMCTMAMALRMKGYDVSAASINNADFGYSYATRFKVFEGVYRKEGFIDEPTFKRNFEYDNPPGAYGDISVTWNEADYGHSMFYMTDASGKIHIYDCQINEEIDVDSLLSRSNSWSYTRLDNSKVDGYEIRQNNWTKYY